eukprot:scaffold113434_cov60-Phaeocystis_antarctica.AAC.1
MHRAASSWVAAHRKAAMPLSLACGQPANANFEVARCRGAARLGPPSAFVFSVRADRTNKLLRAKHASHGATPRSQCAATNSSWYSPLHTAALPPPSEDRRHLDTAHPASSRAEP